MGILDMEKENGELKDGKSLADAIHWIDIKAQLEELSFKDFKEIVFPIIMKHRKGGE